MKKNFKKELAEIGITDNYYVEKTVGMVRFENGKIYLFKKPKIQTSFCFGYGQNGISTEQDFEDAVSSSKNVKEKENFIRNNFEQNFENIDFSKNIYGIIHNNNSMIASIGEEGIKNYYDFSRLFKLTENDKNMLKEEFKKQKIDFKKRLETYWKKFGNSKLKTWTYLMD